MVVEELWVDMEERVQTVDVPFLCGSVQSGPSVLVLHVWTSSVLEEQTNELCRDDGTFRQASEQCVRI